MDARGERFKLRSGNWHGASGTWNGRGDDRPSGGHGGEFAYRAFKDQCADDEYAAGVAWTGRFGQPVRSPDGLLCRPH